MSGGLFNLRWWIARFWFFGDISSLNDASHILATELFNCLHNRFTSNVGAPSRPRCLVGNLVMILEILAIGPPPPKRGAETLIETCWSWRQPQPVEEIVLTGECYQLCLENPLQKCRPCVRAVGITFSRQLIVDRNVLSCRCPRLFHLSSILRIASAGHDWPELAITDASACNNRCRWLLL